MGRYQQVDIHIPIHEATYNYVPIVLACCAMQTYTEWHCTLADDPKGEFKLAPALELVESWGIPIDHSKCTVIKTKSDWLHDKRNELIKRTKAPLVCNFDSDDYYMPDYLELMVKWLHDHADWQGVFRGCRENYNLVDRSISESTYANGAGHWLYRREWQCKRDVWFSAPIINGQPSSQMSDCAFIATAQQKDAAFNCAKPC